MLSGKMVRRRGRFGPVSAPLTAVPARQCARAGAPDSPKGVLSPVSFKVGDKVVYPHHGAAVVERRETKVAFGEKR